MKLEGARVLLTGASGGIGRALASELSRRGSQLLLSARNEPALLAMVESLARRGQVAEAVASDLCISAERAYLAQFASEWMGGVNVLVHCAGAMSFGFFDETPASELSRMLSVNFMAPMLLTRELLPDLKLQPEARVVAIGSTLGHIGQPGFAGYCASKAALACFVEAMQRECAESTVSFCYVAPRPTRTKINSDAVIQMNRELGVSFDSPERVAVAVADAIERDAPRTIIGWRESLRVRLNTWLPRLADSDLRARLAAIRRFAERKPELEL